MHRIDGPTAAPGGLWTEGDPGVGTPATIVSATWMNDTQENLMAVLAAAAITPVKGNYLQLLEAIRGVAGGAMGGTLKLRALITTASATATFTADEIVVKAGLGGKSRILSAFNQSIDLTVTGIGGMVGGAATAGGYVAIYAAVKDDGTRGIFGVNATAVVAPEVAASPPATYTQTALLTVLPTVSTSQFTAGSFVEDGFVWIPDNVFYTSATQQASLFTRDLSAVVPLNAKRGDFSTTISSSSATVSVLTGLAGSAAVTAGIGIGEKRCALTSAAIAGAGFQAHFPNIPIITPQTGFYRCTVAGGTMSFSITCSGYAIR